MSKIHSLKLNVDLHEQPFVCEEVSEKEIDGFWCLKIETMQHLEFLIDLLSDCMQGVGENFAMFRGQRDASWDLSTSLEVELKKFGFSVNESIIQKHLNNFKNHYFKLCGQEFELPDHEIWALGQHYGLKTPFLDWSKSIDVALYFSMKDVIIKDVIGCKGYSAVYFVSGYLFNPVSGYHGYQVLSNNNLNSRMLAQDGLFAYYDFEKYIKCNRLRMIERFGDLFKFSADSLMCKFYINHQLKSDIDGYLQRKKIDKDYLFPKLDWCCNGLIEAIEKTNNDLSSMVV
ncbi:MULTISPECIES: FRG domain-containing protein [unclassified Moraxella]|uniref:FRG domain-containing protein n=1 Tax=unclassified Moraxella TaxID=2685852 RepID=UPI00359EC5EA